MKASFDSRTGLVYVDGVAFTIERIKFVYDIMKYGDKNKKQFEYGVTINDTENEAMILINNKNFEEFKNVVEDYKYCSIASDNDFESL